MQIPLWEKTTGQILKARKVVKSLSYEEMQGLAQECLNKDTADEVLETVKTKLGE